MTDQPDLFADLPPPSGPKTPEPTEDEITAAIEETIDSDGICLPRNYVRDMLAGRDPTDQEHRTFAPPTCGICGCGKPSLVRPGERFCEISTLTIDPAAPAGDCVFYRRKES